MDVYERVRPGQRPLPPRVNGHGRRRTGATVGFSWGWAGENPGGRRGEARGILELMSQAQRPVQLIEDHLDQHERAWLETSLQEYEELLAYLRDY